MAIKASVTVLEGPDEGVSFDIVEGSPVVLGRGKADVILSDKKVSGRHCLLEVENDQVYLEDLNSTNGTFIGGHRIDAKTALQNLDEFMIGLSKFSVAIVEELSAFKKANQPETSKNEDPTQSNSGRREFEVPEEDAKYRETGIQRIENLIDGELKSFSKWDHPADGGKTSPGKSIPQISVRLMVRRGPEGLQEYTCTKPMTTMGRKDVDLRVNDLDCSRKHAALEIVGQEKVYVRDLASTNGTYVNGKRIAYQEVKTGDLVQIGQTVFEVEIVSRPL